MSRRNRLTLEQRFWPKVLKSPECWIWTGAISPQRYGRFMVNGINCVAHRISYELLVGKIPEGMELDHLCRNRSCVKPDHLQAVTHQTNVLRGKSPAASHATKTHCVNGHPLIPSNTYSSLKWRKCIACKREEGRLSRIEKKRTAGLPLTPISTGGRNKRAVLVGGIRYESVVAAANAHGLSAASIFRRLRSGIARYAE